MLGKEILYYDENGVYKKEEIIKSLFEYVSENIKFDESTYGLLSGLSIKEKSKRANFIENNFFYSLDEATIIVEMIKHTGVGVDKCDTILEKIKVQKSDLEDRLKEVKKEESEYYIKQKQLRFEREQQKQAEVEKRKQQKLAEEEQIKKRNKRTHRLSIIGRCIPIIIVASIILSIVIAFIVAYRSGENRKAEREKQYDASYVVVSVYSKTNSTIKSNYGGDMVYVIELGMSIQNNGSINILEVGGDLKISTEIYGDVLWIGTVRLNGRIQPSGEKGNFLVEIEMENDGLWDLLFANLHFEFRLTSVTFDGYVLKNYTDTSYVQI